MKPSAKISKKCRIEEPSNPSLNNDVFRLLIQNCASSSQIFALKNLSTQCHDLVLDEIGRVCKTSPIKVDIHHFFLEENPFLHKFVDQGCDLTKIGSQFHKNIRKLCDMLEGLLEINANYSIENLNSMSLGWIVENDENLLKRAPFMLQKRLLHILKRFNGPCVSVGSALLRPSRFIRSFSHRFDTITEIDLGNTRPLAVLKLRSEVFPSLVNLEKLTWHCANVSCLNKLKNKMKMNKLVVTAHPTGRPNYTNFKQLSEFKNLEELYFGFTVPQPPTRMVMDILLNLYQSIWKKKTGTSNQKLLNYFEKLKRIGFWNAPENFFIEVAKRGLSFETVDFGIVSQDLKKLCSFDSVMQALFKWEESELSSEPMNIEHLNLNLHSMPVVSLEYYLPNLMDRINKKMHHLKSVSIFLNCIHSSEMPTNASWSLESKKEKMRKFVVLDSTYTEFSLTCLGTCGLLDLNRQLPTTLRSCSIFLSPPQQNSKKVVQSVVQFIEKLGDINNFPDLEELHIQLWNVRCLEALVDAVTENLGGCLKKLSLFALPKDDHKSMANSLIGKISRNCEKLQCLSFSAEFFSSLLSEKERSSKKWKDNVQNICEKAGIDSTRCRVDIGKLPRDTSYYAKPEAIALLDDEVDFEGEYENEEEEKVQNFTNNGDEYDTEDSMIVSGEEEEVEDKSLDELELLEMKLEKETRKRQNKWERKRKISSSDDEPEEEDVDEDDIIDFDNLDNDEDVSYDNVKKENGFFDDEAEESNAEESDENEEERENEIELDDHYEQAVVDNLDSDDERLINEGEEGRASRKRKMAEEKKRSVKRKRIIVSDDEEEEES